MALLGRKSLVTSVLLFASSALGAQAAPARPACDVGETAKGNAARAILSVNLAREASTPAVAVTNLKNAVKLTDHIEKGDDPIVNAYVLGSALSLWANQPGIGFSPKRGALGFNANPEGTLDLPATLDSLFRVVETAKPVCSDYTAYWRAGQKFYLDVVNGAINALNADKLDSAEYYATIANKLYASSPYGTMVLGSVASKRNDNARAVEYWTKAAQAAGNDTSYRDVRRQMLANIGTVHMNAAATATGAEQVAAARRAADVYTQLLALPGTRGSYASGGRAQLQSALLIAGDTAAAVKTYADLIANPSAYDYTDLLNSAVNASRLMRSQDAAALFEATLAQNPYNRDALFNLAVTYLTLEQNEKVGPLVTRLVALDPGNPENYNLAARAYLSLAKAAQTAKRTPVAAAYNDSTLTWYNTGNKLGAEVTFREFSPSEKGVVIAGTVLDRRDKTEPPPAPVRAVKGKPAPKPQVKSYPPMPVVLTFVALDKTGAVVGTETVTTESLSPGKSANFRVSISGANVVAYRYTIGS